MSIPRLVEGIKFDTYNNPDPEPGQLYRYEGNLLYVEEDGSVTAVNTLGDGAGGNVQAVKKGNDQNRLDTVTPTDDGTLQLALLANSVYQVDVNLIWKNSNSNPDFKWVLQGPSGSKASNSSLGIDVDISGDNMTVSQGTTQGMTNQRFVVSTTNAGTLKIQWSQNTQDAVNPTTLLGISSISATRTS